MLIPPSLTILALANLAMHDTTFATAVPEQRRVQEYECINCKTNSHLTQFLPYLLSLPQVCCIMHNTVELAYNGRQVTSAMQIASIA